MTPFSATQEALAEASQTAAEAAQQAMHSAYAQAFKAKLAVVMKVRAFRRTRSGNDCAGTV